MLCMAAAVAGIDRDELWDRLEVAQIMKPAVAEGRGPRAWRPATPAAGFRRWRWGAARAAGRRLHLRKPDSIQRTVALMVAATALYIPSHLLPIMTVVELGDVTHNTIISGMMTFWREPAPIRSRS